MSVAVWIAVGSSGVETPGEIVAMPHGDVASFAVHRGWDQGGWQVTNLETGFRVGHFYKTKWKAIVSATAILSRKSRDETVAAMARAEAFNRKCGR